jgi:hypothetical protein
LSAYRSAPQSPSPAALDPRLARAFDAHRTRLLTVLVVRVGSVVVLLALALLGRHWFYWTLFAVVAFLQVPGAFILVVVDRNVRRLRTRLEGDVTELAWLHTGPEPRSKLHRIELHDARDRSEVLFTAPAIAGQAAEAARALVTRPVVTTSDEERAAVEPRFRLAKKLGQIEKEADALQAARARAQRGTLTELGEAWRARVDRDGGVAIAPELTRLLDELLGHYIAQRMAKQRDYFTDEIHAKLVEAIDVCRGLAIRPSPRASSPEDPPDGPAARG